LIVRCQCDFTFEEALEFYEENDDDSRLGDVDQYLKHAIGGLAHAQRFHHPELIKAHKRLAAAMAMIERGKYTEIPVDEIRVETRKRYSS
jgi:hypothetical protein